MKQSYLILCLSSVLCSAQTNWVPDLEIVNTKVLNAEQINVPVKRYVTFTVPEYVDGRGCSKATGQFSGHPRFSGSMPETSNYCYWIWTVPPDLDTSKEIVMARLNVMLAATDAGAQTYTLSLFAAGDSQPVLVNGEFGATNVFTIAADLVGKSGDLESVTNVPLTGWRSVIVPGCNVFIRLGRRGEDVNLAATTVLGLIIQYWSKERYE